MEIILKRTVKGLGHVHDVVKINPGYGRNFLIPKGYAMLATESNRKRLAEDIRQAQQKAHIIKENAKTIAEKLKDTKINIAAKVGENGKIFGSITPTQIAAKLQAEGIDIDRKKIIMQDSPKEIGTYSVTLNLHEDITPEININIVAEE